MSQAAPAEPLPQRPHEEGDPPVNEPGEILPRKFGKYTLLRRLATGGMAELYLALHRSVAGFEKLVVIKRILPDMARDQGFITMLLQEARIAATFAHPNIVTIFDVGQADKTYFIAMEHIHGEDLRSVVRAMKPKGVTEFPLEHAIAITLGVAAGLAYAHEKRDLNGNPLNIVHRDVSPQNVLVTFTGDVKVVDFGIAKATQVAGDAPEVLLAPGTNAAHQDHEHHTKVGQLKGKVPYMSPEQARGEPLDGRSDIFSLGVMLFELSTGRRLFRGPNEYETIKMITEGEYPRPSQVNPRVSARLEAVILRALTKDPARRYQNARELQGDLESVVREERIAVSTLSLGSWMQMLFEEKLASQREALLQGKQLADVIAAEEPDQYTAAGTSASLTPAAPVAPSRAPWLVAAAAVLLAGGVGAVVYLRGQNARPAVAAADPAAAARTGAIVVGSTPPNAAIWLNDAPTQYRTPYTLTGLATGPDARYTVRLSAPGYAPFTQEVALAQPNARFTLDATLQRARAEGYAVLEVTTSLPGATVFVDGRQIAGATTSAPFTVPELSPGVVHSVMVRHPDAEDENFTFVAQAGVVERRTMALRERALGPDEAFLAVTTEPANVTLRVGEREVTTGSPFRVRVRAGQILPLAFSAPGYQTEARSLRLRAGETRALPAVHLDRAHSAPANPPPVVSSNTGPATPPPVVDHRPGSLTVGATPWCNVTIDGTAHGESPVANVSLPPGTHTVVCNSPTHGAQTRRVTITPGGSERVRFQF